MIEATRSGSEPAGDLIIVSLGQQGRPHARASSATDAFRVIGSADPHAAPIPGTPHHKSLNCVLRATSERSPLATVEASLHLDATAFLLEAGVPAPASKPIGL